MKPHLRAAVPLLVLMLFAGQASDRFNRRSVLRVCYVIELCAKRDNHDTEMDPKHNAAREKLQRWSAARKR